MGSEVVIIDDQTSILESMEIFFRLRNWEVYTATTGPVGLQFVEEVQAVPRNPGH